MSQVSMRLKSAAIAITISSTMVLPPLALTAEQSGKTKDILYYFDAICAKDKITSTSSLQFKIKDPKNGYLSFTRGEESHSEYVELVLWRRASGRDLLIEL